jgi:3-isopropylmalate/(R)-2-methylmalate dehydratase large subunit
VAVNIIKGKKLARGFRLTICPATSADYIAACEEGLLELFIDYGAQISAAGDHSVVRQGAGVIGKGETLVTTGLYTYNGCMGVADSKVYTTSVETVACASFTRTL